MNQYLREPAAEGSDSHDNDFIRTAALCIHVVTVRGGLVTCSVTTAAADAHRPDHGNRPVRAPPRLIHRFTGSTGSRTHGFTDPLLRGSVSPPAAPPMPFWNRTS